MENWLSAIVIYPSGSGDENDSNAYTILTFTALYKVALTNVCILNL